MADKVLTSIDPSEIEVSISAMADGRRIYSGVVKLVCNDGINAAELVTDLRKFQGGLAATWMSVANVETTSWFGVSLEN